MRVLLNGRDIGGLDPRLERRLWGGRSDRVVEGRALSAAESIRARTRQLMFLILGAAVLVSFTLVLNVVVIALRAPQALGYVIAAFLGVAILAAALAGGLLGLMIRDHSRRVAARASPQLAPGTAVRLDAAGLTVGGHTSAWAGLRIAELEIRERQGSESRVTRVDRLALSDGGRLVPLDALFLSNGRAVVEQAWFRVRSAGAGS